MFTKKVSTVVASFKKNIAALEQIHAHHTNKAVQKRSGAEALHAEANDHDVEATQALKVASNIKSLIGE